MKTSRLILPALLTAALLGGALVTESIARPNSDRDYGCQGCQQMQMHGQGWQNRGLAPEQQEKYMQIVDEYAKRMNPLQDEIFVKRQELGALRDAANPDVKAVREAAKELTKLNRQMGVMHDEMSQRLEKEVGAPANPGGSGPHHMRGHGTGHY